MSPASPLSGDPMAKKECPNCHGSHRPTCVTKAYDTYVYLADGTKVVLRRGPEAKGRVWLEVVPQEIIILKASKGRNGRA